MSRNTVSILLLTAGLALGSGAAYGADPQPQTKSSMAKNCANCHLAEPNILRGYFDNVAFKAKTIQVRIDDTVELVKFDEDEVKVVSTAGKSADGDLLHQTRIGQELKIEYSEKDGVKTALRIVEKPTVKVPKEILIGTAELEKLVAQGTRQAGYFLFDSRPPQRFQEGAIPGAVNLPYPSFDAQTGKLPADKKALLVFYCSGLTCSMSPESAFKAKKLGYTNLKVYREGIPGWSKNEYTVLTAQSLNEAWIGPGQPLVLLDVRSASEAAPGYIVGAVSFPAAQAAKLIKTLPAKERKPPLIVYDAGDGKQARRVAQSLLQAGYGEVKLLTGGYAAWRGAKYPTATGKLPVKAAYTPKPRPGEIDLEEFKKLADRLPAGTQILDVRNPDEVKTGMLKNAKNIPAEEIKARAAEIPRDQWIVTQCSTGVRAEMAYHALRELGYTKVKFVNAKMQFETNGAFTISKE